VEESSLLVAAGKLRLPPKSGDLSGNPNNWRGIQVTVTLLAVIAPRLFCSVLSNRMTSHWHVHWQVIGLEAQCGFMPGKSTVDAIFMGANRLPFNFKRQRGSRAASVWVVPSLKLLPQKKMMPSSP
jgi:hypothetical protein